MAKFYSIITRPHGSKSEEPNFFSSSLDTLMLMAADFLDTHEWGRLDYALIPPLLIPNNVYRW